MATRTVESASESAASWPEKILGSPVLWGLTLTTGFYAVIPFLPIAGEQAQRYFCSHPLEYALVGLFFIGLAILAKRGLALRHERAALVWNPLVDVRPPTDAAAAEETLRTLIDSSPTQIRRTLFIQRIRETAAYLKGRSSHAALESHIKHLADAAFDRLHDSYSLLLTINWAVPIIGFLGTVIGITLAIANVTPEQLDTSLNNVTGGLAVAFDTTTVAMSFSLVLVFAYDWIKRSEQKVLSSVDEIALHELLPLITQNETTASPLDQAQADAALQLIDRTESLVREQTELWRDSIDGLRQRWSETINDQQRLLSDGLSTGVSTTLDDHAQQLHDVRQDFLSAFEQATVQFTTALETDRQSREKRDESAQQQFADTWQRVSDDLRDVIRSHDAQAEDRTDSLIERLGEWQTGLERNTKSVESQMDRLQKLTDSLVKLADQEDHLVRVQTQLNDNLEAIHTSETFDQTLHNLTAAVHLLTARASSRAA